MLGQDLTHAAASAGHDLVALSRRELDITDEAAVRAALARARAEIVVNCAAWTDVDGAESSASAALEVNGAGAGNVARAAADVGAWTLHVSSDYVFDGLKGEPYVESDSTRPLSEYGHSKLAGELAVAEGAPDAHTIVRSSWLFGSAGKSFPGTILRLASERDELTVVDDQVGCPTFTGHLGEALVELASGTPLAGIVHVAADGQCSWFELAQEIVARAGVRCEIKPGSTADLGRPAPRPPFSVLRSERSAAPVLPDWRVGLGAFLESGVPS
jgi:dTDP-4-dehydrorhamnose reductase